MPARGDVRKLLDDVAEGRGVLGEGATARKRTKPAPTEANRVHATLHLFYQWLHKERQEWLGVTAHPLAGLDKPSPERVRTRTYSNQEIRALLSAARGTELEDYLPLLFHTATRSEETRAMKWGDLDFERPSGRSRPTRRRPAASLASPMSSRCPLAPCRSSAGGAGARWLRSRPTSSPLLLAATCAILIVESRR